MIVEKSDTFSFANSAAKLLFREPTGDCYEIVSLGGIQRVIITISTPQHDVALPCLRSDAAK